MQNQLITQTASRQFQSAIVNNHAEHPAASFNDLKLVAVFGQDDPIKPLPRVLKKVSNT